MKVQTVQAELVASSRRLDSSYFVSSLDPVAASLTQAKAEGLATRRLGGIGGIGKIWAPARFKRSYAGADEARVPYLRPYDVFDYLPEPADWLSATATHDLASYQLAEGMILQTCSGRNLGPAVIVDSYLAGFVLSHDMLRLTIEDEATRHFVLAFLNSSVGRQSLRRDKTGSVIDHISVAHLEAQEIPVLAAGVVAEVSADVARAVELRGKARSAIAGMMHEYQRQFPWENRVSPLRDGWTVDSSRLQGRLDAAFYDPAVAAVRSQLLRVGGVRVADVARVFKPAGRYKTRYVGANRGTPLLSGGQLLQARPINLQFMAPEGLGKGADYELRAGWIAYPADGRAEEALGTPALITADRDGWLASGHVGRVVPSSSEDAGWLFLALNMPQSQAQLKARASGSVVDATFAEDMEEVILPPLPLGIDTAQVAVLWDMIRESESLESNASRRIEETITSFSPG